MGNLFSCTKKQEKDEEHTKQQPENKESQLLKTNDDQTDASKIDKIEEDENEEDSHDDEKNKEDKGQSQEDKNKEDKSKDESVAVEEVIQVKSKTVPKDDMETSLKKVIEMLNKGKLHGYQFTDEGELRDKDKQKYRFERTGSRDGDAEFYQKMGDEVMNITQESLQAAIGLEKKMIPLNAADNDPQSFIFASKNALTTPGKLMIMIHGSGNVIAGIWSRKVMVYDNVFAGSQISYIKRALKEGYEVILLNTNLNSKYVDSVQKRVPIKGSERPEDHALYVWDNFIVSSKAKYISIVAHSYGGVVTTELACERTSEFLGRVFAVAFTDSVHHLHSPPEKVVKFFCNNARNWVSSELELDTPIEQNKGKSLKDAPKVSAGDMRHEWTTPSAENSVFAFIEGKFKERSSLP